MIDKNQEFHIRRITENDRKFIFSLITDPVVMKYIFSPMTEKDATARFESYLDLNAQKINQGFYLLEDSAKTPIGYALLRPYHWDKNINGLELGYLIAPAFWGKGQATVLAEFIVSLIPRGEICYALIHQENRASQKVVSKFGFEMIGPSNMEACNLWRKIT